MLVGGIAANFGGGYRLGGGREFVIEGDEYDSAFFDKTAKFLKYLPDIAIVNNIEFDHADIYPDVAAVELAFKRLAVLVPRNGLLLLGADSPRAAALAAHARQPGRDLRRRRRPDLEGHRPRRRCRAGRGSRCTSTARWSAPSRCRCSARTTCATRSPASRCAPRLGIDTQGDGRGAEDLRRASSGASSCAASVDGIEVYDDFAHHPTAVAETIAALRLAHPTRRLWAIFEPRSASSCLKVFQSDFVEAFEGADQVVVAPVFRAKLAEDRRLSPDALVADLRGEGPRRPRRGLDRRHRRHGGARGRVAATSSWSCRTAASTASTTSCSTRLGASATARGRHVG